MGLTSRALELALTELPAGHWTLGTYYEKRGMAHQALGDLDSARMDLEEGRRLLSRALGADHRLTRRVAGRLAAINR